VDRVFVKSNKSIYRNLIKECLDIEHHQVLLNEDLISWINIFHYIVNKTYSGPSLCLKNILVNYLYNAKKAVPGSELWLLKFLVSNYKLKRTLRLSTAEASRITQGLLKNERSRSIFKNIPDVLGSTGKVIVSKEQTREDILKIASGCSIAMNLDPRFSSQIQTSDIKLDNSLVLIIEGAPASVSELNKLLTYCYDNKSKLILLARSYPSEVISTLATNWQKNRLSVIPFVYGDELSNINSHADLAAISGATPITPMMGDTMQTNFLEKFGKLLNVSVQENVVIADPTTSPKRLVRSLMDKIKNTPEMERESAQMLHERIAGLANDSLKVCLKASAGTNIIKDELDVAIPYYNHLCYNACEIEIEGKTEILPWQVFLKADELSSKFVEQINSIGGFLVTNNK
jgi:hypothetical protein